MDNRQQMIRASSLFNEGLSYDEIATALKVDRAEAIILVTCAAAEKAADNLGLLGPVPGLVRQPIYPVGPNGVAAGPSDKQGTLNLNTAERGWLDEFRPQLEERFPGLVEDILIYGPYSRGISDPDVDMNLLVLIQEGDRDLKDDILNTGMWIDISGFFVAPSAKVYTLAEREDSKRNNSPIYQRVASEGISVA